MTPWFDAMGPAPNNQPLRGRLATRDDDAAIRRFVAQTAMPGGVALSFACEPSFFDALDVQGFNPRVLIGEQAGQIKALGVMATRLAYVNGEPREIGYLSTLRLDPSIRHTMALARGYRFFRALHSSYLPGRFYLSSILEQNALARSILTSGRAGLPRYSELTPLDTFLIPLVFRGGRASHRGLSIVPGSGVEAGALAGYLDRAGRSRQFFPVYTAEDLHGRGGVLRGLRLDDFLVALKDGRIVGTLAVWDQSSFRQHRIASYGAGWRPCLAVGSLLGRAIGLPPLPRPGETVRDLTAACVAVEGNDTAVFDVLLREALAQGRDRGGLFLCAGFTARDPLRRVAERRLHIVLRSRIFAVDWGDAATALPALDGRPFYMEVGSL